MSNITRMSQLFGRTMREPPAEAQTTSHALLLRGGFVRPLESGLYACLPLGQRVLRRLEAVLHKEMAALGAQEMHLPVTSEEALVTLARREIRSYRDLPRVVYTIQAPLHRQAHSWAGLLPTRGFPVKRAYSLHADEADLDRFYLRVVRAYGRTLARCGLPFVLAEADGGRAGPTEAHQFLMPHSAGEERLVRCPRCGYAANVGRAEFRLPPSQPLPAEPARPVATPGCATIADVTAFLGVLTSQTLKAVFYAWEQPSREPECVLVLIRGDLEVNERKLQNLLRIGSLRPATEEEIRAAGAEPGFASPVGLPVRPEWGASGLLVVGDRSIQTGANFVAGANREGYHLVGVNYPRDFAVTVLADVAQAQEGHLCAHCGGPLASDRAVELARCAKPGSDRSETSNLSYLGPQGEQQPVAVGSYSIGLGPLVAAVVEAHHDEQGIIWPPVLAPFDVHLVLLGEEEAVQQVAEQACDLLQQAHLTALLDDRGESAGVKFADADLLGCPIRLTVSRRSLNAGGVEVKTRWEKERQVVAPQDLPGAAQALLDRYPCLGDNAVQFPSEREK